MKKIIAMKVFKNWHSDWIVSFSFQTGRMMGKENDFENLHDQILGSTFPRQTNMAIAKRRKWRITGKNRELVKWSYGTMRSEVYLSGTVIFFQIDHIIVVLHKKLSNFIKIFVFFNIWRNCEGYWSLTANRTNQYLAKDSKKWTKLSMTILQISPWNIHSNWKKNWLKTWSEGVQWTHRNCLFHQSMQSFPI